jgi:uncharacterized membrane protein
MNGQPRTQPGSEPVSPVKPQSHAKTLWMVQTAILSAIVVVMAFTPLGYLKTAGIEITFMTIPVIVGAIIVGPGCGAVLGAVFGITSFLQCFGISPFGTILLGIDPILTFLLCMVPRVLMGWLVGLIFRALSKFQGTRKFWSYAIGSVSGALLNTVFFVGFLLLFFGSSEYIRSFGNSTLAIIGVLVGLNAAIEAVVGAVVGTAVTKALGVALASRRPRPAA